METPHKQLVLVTGPSGAGRGTAINALEDLGYEAIDNLPLSMIGRLLDGPPLDRPLALGLDVRNRDFSAVALLEVLEEAIGLHGLDAELLYLDCSEDVLQRRYSETRRRHPLSPSEDPAIGITREHDILASVRTRADILINTSELSPHDLRDELGRLFGGEEGARLSVLVQSFSYKRGLPRGADMVFDTRFLRNPHWDISLRSGDGRERPVQAYVEADARFESFFDRVSGLARELLPAYRDEGKTHFTIAFGCTGGRHRSVTLAERLAKALAEEGWQVSIRHRELERAAHGVKPAATQPIEERKT
ncbi:RNase adapter RapZ [Lentibacter algarum]|uniref:RNase adapter RapZ n=1 Tax=Lentibacter TaxID=1434014 RepID=UPI0026EDBBC3|nr:RNase adapter RapZ [Lentibacter algarum]